MKNIYCMMGGMLIFLLFTSSCMNSSDKITISANSHSEYMNTFNDLDLGILYDFDFKLPHADKRWVTIWVEAYIDGEKRPLSNAVLSYGHSPNEISEGQIGFGMINNNEANQPLFFLYGPSSTIPPHELEINLPFTKRGVWDYAIGSEKIELQLETTTVLGVYRESPTNSYYTYDFQNEEQLDQMISRNDLVLLLKMKVEEREDLKNEE